MYASSADSGKPNCRFVGDSTDGLRGDGLGPLSRRDVTLSAAGELGAEPAGEGPTEELGEN
jgi:hypothetical protein